MSKKATTKDELFLLKLYEMASALGDPEGEIDKYAIGRAIGQNDKGVDTISNLLAQTNFIKKTSDNRVYLTPHGLNLVRALKDERG